MTAFKFVDFQTYFHYAFSVNTFIDEYTFVYLQVYNMMS